MNNNKYFPFLLNTVLFMTILYLLSKIGYLFAPIKDIARILLVPIIIAIYLYYALRPIVRNLQHPRVNKGISVILVMILVTFAITYFIINFGTTIKTQFENSFATYVNTLFDYGNIINTEYGSYFQQFELTEKTIDSLKNALLKVSTNVLDLFSQISNIGTQIILTPFILFYLLKEDDYFINIILNKSPKKYKNTIKEMTTEIDTGLSTYISGQLLVALIIGILMYIGYLIIGLPNALLMGFFATITSVIPLIGAFLGIVPAVFIALTINTSMVIKVIVVAIIVQQIEGNLITPNIIGNKLNLHPLGVIFIVIISVSVLGFLGAFIGLPLYVLITVLIKSSIKLYNDYTRKTI